jgi:benzylsuccinate CoA-transferase BbsF subunit
MHRLQANGVPAGVVNDSADVLRRDPQIAQRGQWIYLQHAEMGETVYTGAPFQLSRTPGQLTRPAPLLGEHTEQVCREELGLSASEIAALYEQGVLQ